MSWKKIIKEKEEEELPEHVKRARERVKQGLPSQEMPLIPQFEDAKKADSITDMAFMRGQIKQDLDTIREMVDDSNSIQDLEEIMDEVAEFVSKMNKEYGR